MTARSLKGCKIISHCDCELFLMVAAALVLPYTRRLEVASFRQVPWLLLIPAIAIGRVEYLFLDHESLKFYSLRTTYIGGERLFS